MSGFSNNLFGNTNNSSSTTSGTGTAGQSGAPSLFGGGGLFGNPAGGSSTPAPSGSLFGGGGSSTGGSLFGNPTATSTTAGSTTAPAAPSTGLFGSTPASTTSASGTANTTTQPSTNPLFGGGSLFGSKQPEASSTSTPKPASTSLFGALPASSSSATPATTGATSLFGIKPSEPVKPADGAAATTSGSSSTPATTSLLGGGLFGSKAPAASSPATGTTTPAAPLGSLFGNTAPKTDAAASSSGATASSITAPPATGLGLGLFGKPADKKDDATGAKPAEPTLGALSSTALAKPASTASTAVAVAPPSMLKGKTIEEIVNGWTSDLEKHVRDFNKQAAEVAVWDRTLIENSNNLSAIYSHVLAAEREQTEIEQSLDHIEQQQKELVATLDAYEKVTQEILGSQGGSLRALDSGPADTERDKNYMLATDLHSHLDDLSGSLTQMIEAVNALSLPSSGSASAEDPMSQISQILSSHLESLQWIDGAVREVETKVSDVEKRVRESGHGGSLNASRSRSFASIVR